MEFWLNELGIPARLEFAAYNQVIQTLVDTRGVFARNKSGLNVVLLRLEDGGWKHELVAALNETRLPRPAQLDNQPTEIAVITDLHRGFGVGRCGRQQY